MVKSLQHQPTKRNAHDISDSSDDSADEGKRPRIEVDSDSELQRLHEGNTEGDQSATADDDLLKEIEQEYEEKQVGAAVRPGLAKIVNARFDSTNPFSSEKLKEKKQQYATPSNCDWLQVPLCNKDVFRKLKTYQKTKETSLWRIQSDIVRTGVVATEVVDSLFDHQSGSANSLNTKQDGLALLGNAFGALTKFRKELVVAGLHHDCKQLIELPATPTWLFGETAEVSRKMKEIRDLHRIDKPRYSFKYDRHAAPKNGGRPWNQFQGKKQKYRKQKFTQKRHQ